MTLAAQQHLVLQLHHLVVADAHVAATPVLADQNANVLGGKFLKTKHAATNATTNATAAYLQKELTGTNSGQTDALLRTLNATIANALATDVILGEATSLRSVSLRGGVKLSML